MKTTDIPKEKLNVYRTAVKRMDTLVIFKVYLAYHRRSQYPEAYDEALKPLLKRSISEDDATKYFHDKDFFIFLSEVLDMKRIDVKAYDEIPVEKLIFYFQASNAEPLETLFDLFYMFDTRENDKYERTLEPLKRNIYHLQGLRLVKDSESSFLWLYDPDFEAFLREAIKQELNQDGDRRNR